MYYSQSLFGYKNSNIYLQNVTAFAFKHIKLGIRALSAQLHCTLATIFVNQIFSKSTLLMLVTIMSRQ